MRNCSCTLIHNGGGGGLKLDSSVFKGASSLTTFQAPLRRRASSVIHLSSLPCLCRHHRRRCPRGRHVFSCLPRNGGRFSLIVAFAKGTQQQDEHLSSPEETERRSSQSYDGIKDVDDVSHTTPSVCNQEGKLEGPEPDSMSSVRTVALWVCTAVAFGVALGLKDGGDKASEFFAGYLLEQSLSVDNLFVFVLIFKYFKVPVLYQSRVLSYGIAGAVIFRLSIILLGTATLQRFETVNLLLAAILIFSSYKLFTGNDEETDLSDNLIVKTCRKFIPVTDDYDGNRFITLQGGAWKATPLLLTVAVVELSDIAFAVDSIPAVFGVTRDPFIVFSSNVFAILGLRSLYTLISERMSELEYLQGSMSQLRFLWVLSQLVSARE